MPRILLHACCGPCVLFPLARLRADGWTVHGFFYNPNIHPFQEFERRMSALEVVAELKEMPLILRRDYELEDFLRQVAYRESNRCLHCYARRLEAAARLARKSRFDAFTTTLLYSKRQDHEMVRALADEQSRMVGIAFHYEDFRLGWKTGQHEASELGVYRQQYCGCIYSEKERFYKPPRPATDA